MWPFSGGETAQRPVPIFFCALPECWWACWVVPAIQLLLLCHLSRACIYLEDQEAEEERPQSKTFSFRSLVAGHRE